MKKISILLLASLICLITTNSLAKNEVKEILVFAGAGMQAPLDEIGKKFEAQYGVKVIYDYEGSGSLGNKILAGQEPDVFIPGSEKWAKLLKEKGYVRDYQPIAYHTPVVITQPENSRIKSLKDLADPNNSIVLGDIEAAAIGEPSSAILKKAGIEESKMNIKARGITIKQLVLWIEEKNADASIVWNTDARQSGKVKIIEIPKEYNSTHMIPICRMKKDNQQISQYIQSVLSAEGKEIFAKHGFEVVK